MHSNNKKYLRPFFLVGLFSIIVIFAGEWQAAGALWVVILCLLPVMWAALQTSYLSLKIFCATALITETITVPMFYLQADRYAFGEHRPFGFTVLEAVPVFLILGLFLWLVVYLVKLSEGVIGRPVQWTDTRAPTASAGRAGDSARRQMPFFIGILLLMAISLPVKFWMFDMGIGIVGTPPPGLPFRLSGILFYLFNYIVPMIIGYFYLNTKRNSLLLALLVLVYAILIGLTSSSKGVVLLTTAPIIAFAWLDRRWTILSLSGFIAGFGVIIASVSRQIVHISDGLMTWSYTNLGTIETLRETLLRLEMSANMLFIFSDITKRVESFQGLLLSSQFNPDAVGGVWKLLLKAINNSWADLGHDAIHMEYLGYTIPIGFYGVAASLNSWMLMAVNKNLWMVLPFVIYTALTLIILEKNLMRVAHKYRLPLPIAQAVLFFTTFWFYTGPGTLEFRTLFVVSVIFSLLPVLHLGHHSARRARTNEVHHPGSSQQMR